MVPFGLKSELSIIKCQSECFGSSCSYQRLSVFSFYSSSCLWSQPLQVLFQSSSCPGVISAGRSGPGFRPTRSSPGWVRVPSPWGSAAGRLVGAPWWRRWSWGGNRPSGGLPPPGPGPERTSHSGPHRRAEREPSHSPDPPERGQDVRQEKPELCGRVTRYLRRLIN